MDDMIVENLKLPNKGQLKARIMVPFGKLIRRVITIIVTPTRYSVCAKYSSQHLYEMVLLLSRFYRLGNEGTERLHNLLKLWKQLKVAD